MTESQILSTTYFNLILYLCETSFGSKRVNEFGCDDIPALMHQFHKNSKLSVFVESRIMGELLKISYYFHRLKKKLMNLNLL